MSGLGKVQCATCTHFGALHVLPIGGCRINGCPCDAFRDPGKADKETDDGRTFTLRIPEGYVLNVQLVPVSAVEPVEEPTDGS